MNSTACNCHWASQLRKLHESREDDADFTFICEGEVIKAHSFILSMRF